MTEAYKTMVRKGLIRDDSLSATAAPSNTPNASSNGASAAGANNALGSSKDSTVDLKDGQAAQSKSSCCSWWVFWAKFYLFCVGFSHRLPNYFSLNFCFECLPMFFSTHHILCVNFIVEDFLLPELQNSIHSFKWKPFFKLVYETALIDQFKPKDALIESHRLRDHTLVLTHQNATMNHWLPVPLSVR